MRFRVFLLAAGVLVACTDPTAGPAGSPLGSARPGAKGGSPTPKPQVSSPITARDPSGLWTLHDGANEGSGPDVTCLRDQGQLLTLTFADDRLQGSLDACVSTCHQLEGLDGSYGQGAAQLVGQAKGNMDPTGTPVTYVLKFDGATQHLVGTRNGRPVWLAPFIASKDAACDPSPTPQPIATLPEGTVIPVNIR